MRLIDGDALMAKLGIGHDCSICKHDDTPYCCWKPDVVDVCEAICDAPTIEPRKKGKWLPDNNSVYEMRFVCSECKTSEIVPTIGFTKYKPIWDFCPNCGADMREPEDIPMEYFESGGR